MFILENFIADCRAALAADPSHRLVREAVASAVSDPAAILQGFGRTQASRDPKALSRQRPDHSQCDLGADDDGHAAQSSDVGGNRHL